MALQQLSSFSIIHVGDKEELIMKETMRLEKEKKKEKRKMETNQREVRKRSTSIKMIARQNYSNVRSQRNKLITKKMSRKPKKRKQKEDKQKRRRKEKKDKDRICYCRQENHKLLHDGHQPVLLQVATTKWKKR